MIKQPQTQIPPVEKGDIIELTPDRKGAKGDLIGIYNGFVIILKGDASLNTKVQARITNVLNKYAFAEVLFN